VGVGLLSNATSVCGSARELAHRASDRRRTNPAENLGAYLAITGAERRGRGFGPCVCIRTAQIRAFKRSMQSPTRPRGRWRASSFVRSV
jgi:hypothetical protein